MIIHCPVCHHKTTKEENPYRPFCSERCKLIDLGRWAGEKYRIPGEPVNDEPEEITKETDNGNN
ncbi:MAG: DNA gyrase inhibitor YacG [Nitrospirota bacterium]